MGVQTPGSGPASDNDTFTADNSAEIANGGLGDDTFNGGAGDEIYVVDDVGNVVKENLGEGTGLVRAFVSSMLGTNVENIFLI